jgi:hypothetical protein
MPTLSFDEYMNDTLKDMKEALPYLAVSLVMFERYGEVEGLTLSLKRFLRAQGVSLEEYREQNRGG